MERKIKMKNRKVIIIAVIAVVLVLITTILVENGEEIFSKYELVDCIRLKNIASDLMYEKVC